MRVAGLIFLLPVGVAGSAAGADVNFTGTVVSTCSILAATDGLLGLVTDGTMLASEGAVGGLPGTVTILSIGSNTIEVGAPSRVLSPPAYDNTGEAVEVSYFGVSGLSLVTQGYTSTATSFSPGSIAASVLTVNNRIVNPDGFVAGNYATRTEVTCVP